MHSTICTHAHSMCDVVECSASWEGQLSGGRICNELVQIVSIAAGIRDVLELRPESCVEWEEVGMGLCETERRNFLLDETPRERRIGDPDALEIHLETRVLVDPIGDVGNV